jgi:high-affinity Fe2+/Pb2+ permease
MAVPGKRPDERFEHVLTFVTGVAFGVVLSLFIGWLVYEYVL